jgi:proteasome lid subunit RPN8/RPN11
VQKGHHRCLLERRTLGVNSEASNYFSPEKVFYRLTVDIPHGQIELISLHSRESHPVEACGILIGTILGETRVVTEARAARNRLSSESSYEIDPENLFHAFTYAEQKGLEVVGFYHSHPFWSAEASETDKARANYPGFSYLIYSIPKNNIKSFYFDGRRLVPEPVRIITNQKRGP